MRAARAFDPYSNPSAIPVAIATTFLTEPPSSTPTTSSEVYTRKRGAEERLAYRFGHLGVLRGDRHGRRNAARDFGRERRTGEDRKAVGSAQDLFEHLGHSLERPLFDPLRSRHDDRPAVDVRCGLGHDGPDDVTRQGRDDECGLVERLAEVGSGADAAIEASARQVSAGSPARPRSSRQARGRAPRVGRAGHSPPGAGTAPYPTIPRR